MANRPETEPAGFWRAIAEGAAVAGIGILGPVVVRKLVRQAGDWAIGRATDTIHTMSLEASGELEEGPLHDAAEFAVRAIDRMRERLDEQPR